MPAQQIKVTDRHRHALTEVLDTFDGRRFRRSDVADRIYPLTTPRSRERANSVSDQLLREASGIGRIRREGHLHWIAVTKSRALIDGTTVAELDQGHQLSLDTRCPEKWLAVDLETGEVWRGSVNGWKRHVGPDRDAVARLVRTKVSKGAKRA
jgi:hypothetical protein